MSRAHNVPAQYAPDMEAALARMREHGMRVSTARRLLLEALYDADEPLTAEALTGDLDDVASVYRNLETLEQVGIVKHFHLGHGPGLYTLASASVKEFLVCDSCGRVKGLAPAKLEAVRERVRKDTGWEARFTHFPISGLCPDCARKRLAPA